MTLSKLTILLLLSFYVNVSFGQDWITYEKRDLRFPNNIFLKSFNSSYCDKKSDYSTVIKSLVETSKLEIVQTLQATIKNTTTFQTDIVNTETDEIFTSKSVIISKAKLIGMNIEKYYDKKDKIAYVFVYVNKKELGTYYKRQIISNKIKIINEYNYALELLKKDNRIEALKILFELTNSFEPIYEAQSILSALGKRDVLKMYNSEISKLKSNISTQVFNLLAVTDLTMEEASNFLVQSIFNKTKKIKGYVFFNKMTFKNTSMTSDFSESFTILLKNEFANVANYNISEKRDNIRDNIINVTYDISKELIKVSIIFKTKKTSYSTSISIPNSKVSESVIPANYFKLGLLEKLNFVPAFNKYDIKTSELSNTNITIYTRSINGRDTINEEKIPVIFSILNSNKEVVTKYSNKEGVVSCILPFLKPTSNFYILLIKLDIEKFFGISKETEMYKKVISEMKIPSTRVLLKIRGPSVLFLGSEKNLGINMNNTLIEPKIKEKLSSFGYEFSNNYDNIDLIVNINSNSRAGNYVQGIYFTYLDVTVSVIDMKTGNEVYKKSFPNIKGASSNYKQAGIKAYLKVVDLITVDIVNIFLN